MKKRILTLLITGVLLGGLTTSRAQVKLPQASSTTKIEQAIGIKKVTLVYQRPNVNGRVIFGGLEPLGKVWRTGANTIPNITFEEEVTIEGHKVPAGTYGILSIPTDGDWTIILSKNPNQWGAYQYKQEEDFLRFPAKARKTAEKTETFTMAFENVTPNGADLSLAWENTKVLFHIAVDQSKEIMASIDEAMKGEKKPYFQAAQYYYNNNLDINKALAWAAEADKGNTKAPHIKYWRARIQLKAGDKPGAIKTATEGVAMAKAANNEEYIKLNTQVIEQAKN
ncbi:Protein of unknown function (DUF2911) [Sphingobacterium allocomposti]|uniref:DUF2911 family protein n=1 Tax=Sphingobacterium allocomposti TaxID=415956 RepID=A0A5S5DJX4_9SPHI|nr:DUF2911 domain-containing protein [Sphingobacterium composti Yoo et al. 2007 non Ten et al. 2007]TYP95914.1 Protein of unknown function (DUF2911) [Sphingobacterium composti Yoo et al. 2007 non Ten et al. 2007]HLS96461.1 DUF2911 domain-containing protein [Sphingobacterium sp.]